MALVTTVLLLRLTIINRNNINNDNDNGLMIMVSNAPSPSPQRFLIYCGIYFENLLGLCCILHSLLSAVYDLLRRAGGCFCLQLSGSVLQFVDAEFRRRQSTQTGGDDSKRRR